MTNASRSSVPARELILSGQCSAPCLLADPSAPAEQCDCRCGGQYHGVLAPAEVEAASPPADDGWGQHRPWFSRYCGYSEQLLEQTIPVVRNVRQFNNIWDERKRAEQLFAVVERRGQFSFEAKTDTFTMPSRDCDYRPSMVEIGELLVKAVLLAKSNRDSHGVADTEGLLVSGLRSPQDARVITAAFSELWFGNPDGALNLYRALREDVMREPRRRAAAERELPAVQHG